jgi:hypothetical protein
VRDGCAHQRGDGHGRAPAPLLSPAQTANGSSLDAV